MSDQKVKVTQVKSTIGNKRGARESVRSLGLRKIHQSVVVDDNAVNRGYINRASHLLTVEAIAARGLPLAGWVANQVDPAMLRFDENLAALTARLPAPLLGVTPFQADGDAAGAAGGLRLPE